MLLILLLYKPFILKIRDSVLESYCQVRPEGYQTLLVASATHALTVTFWHLQLLRSPDFNFLWRQI
jgi:hypothetical protein